MAVTLHLGSPPAPSISVRRSALAELCACLHALGSPGHHAVSRPWVETVRAELDEELLARAAAYAPLWGAFRARYLLPISAGGERTLDAELAELAALPIRDFSAMTVQALIGKNDTSLTDDPVTLLPRLRLISTRRLELGTRLADDPVRLRADLLGFLSAFAAAAFDREWSRVRSALEPELQVRREALHRHGAGTIAGFATATAHSDPPRIVIDKLYNATVRLDEQPCVLVPSLHGSPHFVVKHFPGYPVVIQYAVSARVDMPSVDTVRQRLAVLQDPTRLRLCYAILRDPVATAELATQMGMTAPQVSRHLRRLREAGLVHMHRRGAVVYYQLDAEAVHRLGPDLLSALYR